jgi:hypothetical protein
MAIKKFIEKYPISSVWIFCGILGALGVRFVTNGESMLLVEWIMCLVGGPATLFCISVILICKLLFGIRF